MFIVYYTASRPHGQSSMSLAPTFYLIYPITVFLLWWPQC